MPHQLIYDLCHSVHSIIYDLWLIHRGHILTSKLQSTKTKNSTNKTLELESTRKETIGVVEEDD